MRKCNTTIQTWYVNLPTKEFRKKVLESDRFEFINSAKTRIVDNVSGKKFKLMDYYKNGQKSWFEEK